MRIRRIAVHFWLVLAHVLGGGHPAEVLAEAEDVRVDCEAGALEAEEGDT